MVVSSITHTMWYSYEGFFYFSAQNKCNDDSIKLNYLLFVVSVLGIFHMMLGLVFVIIALFYTEDVQSNKRKVISQFF